MQISNLRVTPEIPKNRIRFLKEKLTDRALFDAVDSAIERDQPNQILHLGKRDVISHLKLSKPLVEWNKRDPSKSKPSTLLGLLVDILTTNRSRRSRPNSPSKARDNNESSPSPSSPAPIMPAESNPVAQLDVRPVSPAERDG